MCLSKVTQKNVKLKKDKVVYGCVFVDSKGEQQSWLKNITLHKGQNEAGYFDPLHRGWFKKFETAKGYKCGFHRFVKRNDAAYWISECLAPLQVVEHIIPAGTIVTYGRQEDLGVPMSVFDHERAVVIVSPVIINP